MASNKAVEQAAEELYGLPPGDFTGARDKLAKELRKDDREAANAVKALRKPTVAAWALNQLARERPKELKELLSAGEKLRAAQEKLLAGGDRSAFQSAAATERDQVAKLTADTLSLAAEAGERGAGLDQKIAATLHAAALDEETASELGAGRLTKEREAIGGFGGMDLGAVAPAAEQRPASAPSAPKPSRRGSKATGRGRSSTGSAKQRAAAQRDRAAAERERAAAERRERLAAARTDERHARRELDAATKALQNAHERADAAKTHAAEAAERAKKTAERLKEAKRAEAAARKAHAKATADLEREGSDP